MSKTYILWIPHIIMHIETHYSRSVTDAEELFVQSFPMPSKVTRNAHNLNMENIIIHNKTRDMHPSISSTILHVRYSEHADFKSVQSSPIWRYSGSKPHWVIDWLRPGYAYIYISLRCVITGSDNGLSPGWHQGITWTNADLLGPKDEISDKSEWKQNKHFKTYIWKCHLLDITWQNKQHKKYKM